MFIDNPGDIYVSTNGTKIQYLGLAEVSLDADRLYIAYRDSDKSNKFSGKIKVIPKYEFLNTYMYYSRENSLPAYGFMSDGDIA